MRLSKDVFSHGARGGFHPLMLAKFDPRRVAPRGVPAQFMVLGGTVAAPVLSLAGWVGLVLPPTAGLHQAAADLLAAATLGLGTALIGAYTGKSSKSLY